MTNTYDCSVIVPVRNEAGNIDRILKTIPLLGVKTEIICSLRVAVPTTHGRY